MAAPQFFNFKNPSAGVFNKEYLLDTNVCVFLQGPSPSPKSFSSQNYSRIVKNIYDAGGSIFLCPPVIMEFCNAFLQIEFRYHQVHSGAPAKFKDYRKSSLFEKSTESLKSALGALVGLSSSVSAPCTHAEFLSFCDDAKARKVDYNDAIIIDQCKKTGLTLVTDDGDFIGSGIPILSANPAYRT